MKNTDQITVSLRMDDPHLLPEALAGLHDPRLQAQSIGILARVAERKVRLIMPYLESLVACIDSAKSIQIKWDVIHILSMASLVSPAVAVPYVIRLYQMLADEKNILICRSIIAIIARSASAGQAEAWQAYTLLRKALDEQDTRHTGYILNNLRDVARHLPDSHPEMRQLVDHYQHAENKTIRVAAWRLNQLLGYATQSSS